MTTTTIPSLPKRSIFVDDLAHQLEKFEVGRVSSACTCLVDAETTTVTMTATSTAPNTLTVNAMAWTAFLPKKD